MLGNSHRHQGPVAAQLTPNPRDDGTTCSRRGAEEGPTTGTEVQETLSLCMMLNLRLANFESTVLLDLPDLFSILHTTCGFQPLTNLIVLPFLPTSDQRSEPTSADVPPYPFSTASWGLAATASHNGNTTVALELCSYTRSGFPRVTSTTAVALGLTGLSKGIEEHRSTRPCA